MSSPLVTIAWTRTDAVLFGPESRWVRQPLAEDDDRAAVILELWRTEFPEIADAQLLAGDAPSAAAEVVRLSELARQAGLRLALAPPPGRTRQRAAGWGAVRDRFRRPWLLVACAVTAAALGLGGWQWSQARERDRLSRLTAAERAAELRQAESAAMGLRRRATDEEARALWAACTRPRPFAAEWLTGVAAAASPALVLAKLRIDGSRCGVEGRLVAGAPGAETAAEHFRAAIFAPAGGWTVMERAAAMNGPGFRCEALSGAARGPVPAEVTPEEAAAARARLPDKIAVQSLVNELARAWRIEARGTEMTLGVERQGYAVTATSRDAGTWAAVLNLAQRLNGFEGAVLESLELVAAPGASGILERAEAQISLRNR